MRLSCGALGCPDFHRLLMALAVGSALSGCSVSAAPGSLTTASLPPRPAEGMARTPPTSYAPASAIGAPMTARDASGTAYRWNGNRERVHVGDAASAVQPHNITTASISPSASLSPSHMQWKATPRALGRTAPKREAASAAVPATAANEIIVGPSDTLFSLASRHNVSMSSLMTANHLQSPVLKAGQHLTLPATVR